MQRQALLDRARANEPWDVIIIGGGATGLGAAVDAASRGYRTLLLEAYDYAKGTSSRSTKLVHGGVRYLAQGNVALVRGALRERGLLRQNAPHLVHARAFVVPAYRWWDMPFYGSGLTMYDVLAGKLSFGRSRFLSRDAALRHTPTLRQRGLKGGILYYDGQFDDTRLAITLALTAADHGATLLNYAQVTGLVKVNGRTQGVMVRDTETGEEFTARGRVVINAAGVYVDSVRQMDEPQTQPMVAPSQGVHIVLPREYLPGDTAVMIPRTDDGRVLFAVPWHGRVVVGTTDTPRQATPIEPRPLDEEVDFLLHHTARYFQVSLRPSNVLSIFAGLRPLVKGGGSQATASISRDHTIAVAPSGLVTITGGKWTTYRHMAEDVVDRAAEVGGLARRPCVTQTLKLRGWQAQPEEDIFAVYGSDAAQLKQMLAGQPAWDQLLHPNLPYRIGEVIWGARYEAARTVEDVLARRTRALLLDAQASIEAAPYVAQLLAQELGFDQVWQEAQARQYQALARGYLLGGQPSIEATPDVQTADVGVNS